MKSSHIIELIKKEFLLEWRQKYAFMGVLVYVFSTVFVCYLSFKKIIDVPTWNALFWIILLFTSINAVSKSFVTESRGVLLYYYTLANPRSVIVSKLIYNGLLSILLAVMCFGIYSLLAGNVVQDNLLFFITIIFGSLGISGIITLVSAIASKAGNNATLIAILSFPIVLPLLITCIALSKNAIDGIAWLVNLKYLITLIALNVIVWTLGFLLFPYLWRE